MLVRHLLEGQPGRVDPLETERRFAPPGVSGHFQHRAVRHLHPQQELHLPPCLVQQVGYAVGGFRDRQGAVGERLEGLATHDQGPLILVEQLPGGDTAVDHVLTVVTGVVPAAPHIQGVVAGPRHAGHVGVTLVRGHVKVSGRTRVLLTDQIRRDPDTAALVVEERQRVVAEPVVQRLGNLKRVAGHRLTGDLHLHGEAGAPGGDV